MWLKSEIDSLRKLYAELDDQSIFDFLNEKDLAAIAGCGKLTISNLRNFLLVPKHNKNPKTIRITRLNYNFDLNEWLREIEPLITCPLDISIGYSFMATKKDEYIYVFCPKALASYKAHVETKPQLNEFINKLKSLKEADHLENTFFKTFSGSAFTESGYAPIKLVSNTIWISK